MCGCDRGLFKDPIRFVIPNTKKKVRQFKTEEILEESIFSVFLSNMRITMYRKTFAVL